MPITRKTEINDAELEDVVAYLRRAGYVERGQQAETARGRYAIDGAAVEVQPGTDALLKSR